MDYRTLLKENRFASALALLGVRRGDRVGLFLPNLPQFVIAYFGILKLGAISAELISPPSPMSIRNLMKAIDTEQVTLLPRVPTMYVGIVHQKHATRFDLRSVKARISGAAPLHLEVQIKFGELTGGRLVEGFGLTEAAPVAHCNPIYGERRSGSIGLPLPDVEAVIMHHEILMKKPVGEVGELWLRGPQVMRGYRNKPEESAATITPDGWLRAGDLAKMDDEGYIDIVDRLKDTIIASGFTIAPSEVEEVLSEHPKILEAVVVEIPDPQRGETAKV